MVARPSKAAGDPQCEWPGDCCFALWDLVNRTKISTRSIAERMQKLAHDVSWSFLSRATDSRKGTVGSFCWNFETEEGRHAGFWRSNHWRGWLLELCLDAPKRLCSWASFFDHNAWSVDNSIHCKKNPLLACGDDGSGVDLLEVTTNAQKTLYIWRLPLSGLVKRNLSQSVHV